MGNSGDAMQVVMDRETDDGSNPFRPPRLQGHHQFPMSVILMLLATLGSIRPSSTDEPTGVEAVRDAITEFGSLTDGTFEATLGEPTIEANRGRFSSDPKIIIPIENIKYGDAGTLVFDVPMGRRDTEAQFWTLLQEFGLDFEELEQLEGQTVPIRYSSGNVVVLWDQLRDDTSAGE